MNPRVKRSIIDSAIMVATVTVALVAGNYVPGIYKSWNSGSRSGDFAEHVNGLPAKITLYGTTTCLACKRARDFLRRSAIPFNDQVVDASTEAEELYSRLGESAVPVLVSKDQIIVGFNEKRYISLALPPAH